MNLGANEGISQQIRRLASLVRARPRSAGSAETKRDPWWESKIILLLVGAVLTNLLAPRIQDNLEAVKWQRQQQVDQARQWLAALRGFLVDFADLHARTIQLDTWSNGALTPHPAQIAPAVYQARFDDLVLAWHGQAAKVSGQLLLFKENGAVRDAFQRYSKEATQSFEDYRNAVLLGNKAGFLASRKDHSGILDNLNDTVLNLVRKETHDTQEDLMKQLSQTRRPWWRP